MPYLPLNQPAFPYPFPSLDVQPDILSEADLLSDELACAVEPDGPAHLAGVHSLQPHSQHLPDHQPGLLSDLSEECLCRFCVAHGLLRQEG